MPTLNGWRIVAIMLTAVAWALGAAAIAVAPPRYLDSPGFVAFVVGPVILFIVTYSRHRERGPPHAVAQALLEAGALVVAVGSAILAGFAVKPMLVGDGSREPFEFVAAFIIVLYAAGLCWEGRRRPHAARWSAIVGAAAAGLVVLGIAMGPSSVLVAAGLSITVLMGIHWWHLRRRELDAGHPVTVGQR